MTTEHIPQLPQVRGHLKTTAGHVRDRSKVVRETLAALDQDETDVRIGAQAVLQSIDDERQLGIEEGQQLAAILAAATVAPPAPPAAADTTPATAETVVVEQPSANPANAIQRTTIVTWVRAWRLWSWLLAFVGVIVALIVWSNWPEWPGRNIDTHAVRTLVNIVWFVAFVCTGFFLGGWIGSFIDRRRARQEVTTTP